MNATINSEIETNLGLTVIPVVSSEDSKTDNVGQEIEATGALVDASLVPEHTEDAVTTPGSQPEYNWVLDKHLNLIVKKSKGIKFLEFEKQAKPSQPLFESAVQRGTNETKDLEMKAQEDESDPANNGTTEVVVVPRWDSDMTAP